MIDVGGQSSRPGAVPVIREVVQRYGALVSIDTYRASVAAAALDAGAVLVNDISAMRFDAQMALLNHLELLHDLGHLRALGQPLLVGTLRKSFLGHVLRRQVGDRLAGTLATVLHAVRHGAALVRVHDVAAVVQTVRLFEALNDRVETRPPTCEKD